MQTLALLFIGFSTFYALVLILSQLFCNEYKDKTVARWMGLGLFLSLIGLQLSHFFYLTLQSNFIHSSYYIALLFIVAPCFYFYAKPLLKGNDAFPVYYLLHFVPVGLAFFISYELGFLLAFIVGCAYLIWLAKAIYALKAYRTTFKSELLSLSIVFIIAVLAAVFGLAMPLFSEKTFFSMYSISIGLAFFLVAIIISSKPHLQENLIEVAKEAYAVSTLTSVDCQQKLSELNDLMSQQKLYQQNNLDLHTVASQLDLSTHQLSELINTSLGKSFSRYLREQRITAAQSALVGQPKASVLSIGTEVGFSSQSNFYEAFKEIVGTTPAKYRKLNL
jgi:AraC-like DNA-binding protein